MKRWWIRPLVRIMAALILPFVVPAVITGFIWALPGDPASIICPPGLCGGTEALARRWNLDGTATQFFLGWVIDALNGELGNSWRLYQGVSVAELIGEALPNTMQLLGVATLVIAFGALGSVTGTVPERADPLLRIVGLVPALVLALVGAALVELSFGFESFSEAGRATRLLAGAVVLGLADGAFSGAVTGTRGLFQRENQQRYVGVAVLRGEQLIDNTFPNVAPALAGQMRARVIHLMSGAVIVEVILRIDGLGDLLWGGTLKQDFGVVLGAATLFAVLSAGLLVMQAMVEIGVAIHVRRSPAGVTA